jgi:TIR domain
MKKIYRSIKDLVIDAYNSEGAMPSYEKLTGLVREYFPNSKWQKTHYVWYKSQIKTGRLSIANVTKQSENTTSDIFISYKREEQAIARKLANALESEGWSVWWDPKLRAGEHFDDVIEKALNEAKCVIVMWSKLSVQSRYVRSEATYALDQDKLVPVRIENANLPFRFRGVHTLSLLGWDGSKDTSDFRKLVEDIAAIVGPPATECQKGQTAAIERSIPEHASQEPESKLKPGTIFLDTPVKIIFERGKEPFERGFPNNLVRRFAIGIENTSSERLHHCSVTIQDVNPKANLETDSSLKLSSPQKKTFGINAFDTEYIDIVQFDELNGFHENLGIELMCYSVHGFTNLPLEHHYTLTIRASVEKGRFAEEEFNLWIQDRKVHFTKLTT